MLRGTRKLSWPVALCWITIMLDGFDRVVLGTVIPTLNETGELGIIPAAATFVATIGLAGGGSWCLPADRARPHEGVHAL